VGSLAEQEEAVDPNVEGTVAVWNIEQLLIAIEQG